MVSKTRFFTMDDQLRFAQLTGDRNPLHISPDWAAARYPGQIVVHGIHVLLWAIDAAFDCEHVRGLSVTFIKPILLGDSVTAHFDGHVLTASVRGELVMRAKLSDVDRKSIDLPRARVADESPWLGRNGSVVLPNGNNKKPGMEFPVASKVLGAGVLEGLMSLSTLVGMECPGLGGMFSGFSVVLAAEQEDSRLSYHVSRFDPRFSQITMQVAGYGIKGEVTAHVEPPSPDSGEDFANKPGPEEFLGQRPLIVGGSNGLGKTTALLLATGGADPIITYYRSISEAQAVADRVNAMGRRCNLLQLDVEDSAQISDVISDSGFDIRQIYYFASPRIFRRRLEPYQSGDVHDFIRIYVDGFYNIVRAAQRAAGDRKLSIFYPSSSAVDEASSDLLEYAAAKQLGEALCRKLEKKYKSVSINVARLPRVATRQTQSFLKVAAAAPEEILLPLIREIQRDK
ncbi:MAG: SDR family NAD(P)-dependent oxidoreductase [Pseudolabrys sp.]|nr:SDR family NAD(P)-dependent oxidoreductase [Pseudolabrys sp.]